MKQPFFLAPSKSAHPLQSLHLFQLPLYTFMDHCLVVVRELALTQ